MASSQNIDQETPKIIILNDMLKIVENELFQKDLIQAISNGFVAFEKGDFFAAPVQTMGAPPMAPFVEAQGYAGQTCVKSGYFRNNAYFVIKVASGGSPLPNSGLMQVYSQQSGRLQALLLDEGVLTELRTAAVGALASRLFAPKEIQAIGILGTGIQSRYQLRMLKSVTPCRSVIVWGRTVEKANAFQAEMAQEGWDVSVAAKPDDLLTSCDLVVTTTYAREAVLGCTVTSSRESIRAGLITCIGSDAPGKQELSLDLIRKADLKVADSLDQTRTRGEFQYYCAEHPNATDLISLGSAIEDQSSLRQEGRKDGRLIIFDSSGVPLQDCVIAQMVIGGLK